MSSVLKFPPRDATGQKEEPKSLDIFNPDPSQKLSTAFNSSGGDIKYKRRKIDVSIDSGVSVRPGGEFVVQTPDFSVIDWNSIDFIIISNFRHMLALPFITEYTKFEGSIYATEPTIELGGQLMKELVHYFGESPLSDATKRRASTQSKKNTGSIENHARSLYSLADVQACIKKIQPVRYGEELMVYDSLKVTAFSSGYCLGGANWTIEYAYKKACISIISSSSIGNNIHPAPFDNAVLENANVMLLTDIRKELNDSYDEILNDIQSSVANSLRQGGNILFPCTLNGIIFDLLKNLSNRLKAAQNTFYIASPVAEESLQYSNILSEWMCVQNQEKVYVPEDPMEHKNLMAQGRLIHVAHVDSSINERYKEPCIVFAGHPSLRSGPVIDFIHKWREDSKNIMILTDSEFDCNTTLSLFEGMKMKIKYSPIDIRMSINQLSELMKGNNTPQIIVSSNAAGTIEKYFPYSRLSFYEYLDTLKTPIRAQYERTQLKETLAKNIRPIKIEDAFLAPLQGNLLIQNSRFILEQETEDSPTSRLLLGNVQLHKMLTRLSEVGIDDVSITRDEITSGYIITLDSPAATIKLNSGRSTIETFDNDTRKYLSELLISSLDVLAEKDIESVVEFFENFQSSSFFTDSRITTTSATIDTQNQRERRAILTNITKINGLITGYRDCFLVSLSDNKAIDNSSFGSVDASLLMKLYQLFFEILEKRHSDLMRILLLHDQFIVFATRKLLLDWIFVADLHYYYQTKKDTLSSILPSFTQILWAFLDEISVDIEKNHEPNKINDKNKNRYHLAVNAILEIYHKVLKDFRKRLRSQCNNKNVKNKGDEDGGGIDSEDISKNSSHVAAKQILHTQDIWKWIIEFIKYLNNVMERMTITNTTDSENHQKKLQDDDVYTIVIVPSLVLLVDVLKIKDILLLVKDDKEDDDDEITNNVEKESLSTLYRQVSTLLLNDKQHITAIRRVLEILLLISKSTDNDISSISTVLFSKSQYTLHLLTNLTPPILEKILFPSYDEYTEFFYTPPPPQSPSLSQISQTTIIYDRESLKRVSVIYMSSAIRLIDIFTEQKQEDKDEDDGKTFNKILVDFESIINNIEIHKNYNVLNEVINTVKVLLESPQLPNFISHLFGENDGDMISFILSMVQLSTRFPKFEQRIEELAKDKKEKSLQLFTKLSTFIKTLLIKCTPHDLFLRFTYDLSFDHSVLLDFLISDETEFLEFFVIYCKYLVCDVEGFVKCFKRIVEQIGEEDGDDEKEEKKDNINTESEMETEIELSSSQQKSFIKFLTMFMNLRQAIESLMSKHLFPYNATSLVRRIKQVEETLANLFEDENN
ncbi:1190_t:CDS:10 [Ambispora gerdemannii]|uniref:1190_t:CDS:1 n=1 Tax=Ambispora gerdemannii TaxID=144530 RepID=A0A9N8YI99_9GLOM|nr:1190_t:CDS:10 [Ambispora gerdemannii]